MGEYSEEDIGNIVSLEHVNVQIPDQSLATLFYVVGMGFTRDPYLNVGLKGMSWVRSRRLRLSRWTHSRWRRRAGRWQRSVASWDLSGGDVWRVRGGDDDSARPCGDGAKE